MLKNETDEHKRLKEIVHQKLEEWFGVSITEYPATGHELDVFSISISNKLELMVEIIWTPTATNFYRDISIIYTSDATIKVVIVNPLILNKEEFVRYFNKLVISEAKRGLQLLKMIDGKNLFNDDYLNNKFKDTILGATKTAKENTTKEILDLRQKILSDEPIAPLISRCIELAKKTGLTEDKKWLECELYGFPIIQHEGSKKTNVELLPGNPQHRRITGKINFLFYDRKTEYEKFIQADYPLFLRQPVTEIEDIIRNFQSEEIIFYIPLPEGPKKEYGLLADKMPMVCRSQSLKKCVGEIRLKVHKFLSSLSAS